MSFSPNPSKGNINISYTSSKAGEVTLRITSLMGEVVYTGSKIANAGINTWNINIHVLPGSYYLSAVTNSGNVITKSLRVE